MSTRETPLTPAEARAMLAQPGWRDSTGIYPGQHWRKREADGSCYHMRLADNGEYLWHKDEHDPVARPLHHLAELAHHAPKVSAAAGVVFLGLLALSAFLKRRSE